MSRLNYMSEQELALWTVSEEVDALERLVRSGYALSEDEARLLAGCIDRLTRLATATSWDKDQEPLPDWLKPSQHRTGSTSQGSQSAVAGKVAPIQNR